MQQNDLLQRAQSLLRVKDFDAAAALLKKALPEPLAFTDASKDILYHLALAYEGKDMLKEAQETYGYIIEDDYLYKDAKDRLFGIMKFLKEKEDAGLRYTLLGEIGRGGMGVVYKAQDNELGRTVALKMISPSVLSDADTTQRFIQEAKTAASLNHPNIVKIFDVVSFQEKTCICMEYVEGASLRKAIEQTGKLQESWLVKIALQVCEALCEAHTKGIIHRDIKPDNILLTKDVHVKVTDFGIAKIAGKALHLTADGKAMGTLAYASPEQLRREEPDARSDIYSLGATLYEALAGKPPFYQGDIAHQHLHAEPPKIKGASPAFENIVDTCLSKNKQERYQDCKEISGKLRAIKNA